MIKHTIFVSIVWNSLLPSFYVETIGNGDRITQESEYNGVKILYYIKKEVNNSTATATSMSKDKIE